jgi:hypothetical protein
VSRGGEAQSPLAALVRGVAAGVAGTAAMTAYQELVARRRRRGGPPKEPSWEHAPAPAEVARRVIEGVFKRPVPAARIPLLTSVVHWGYGTGWGAVYGVVRPSLPAGAAACGLGWGAGVWASSYAQLVPMGLYEPPWRYSAKTVAVDVSYHLVYGLALAGAYELTGSLARALPAATRSR